jgi:glycosyltransferase involved in cell wall biosynthesis
MIKGRDILIVGLQSLDSEIGSNCVNIAHEFARHNRVLYVNYAIDRFTLFRQKNKPLVQKRKEVLKGNAEPLVQINENLWNLTPKVVLESINQLKPGFLFQYLNKNNSRKFAKEIKLATKHLKFSEVIVFNDSDFYRSYYLKEQLQPKTYLYYTRDNMVATDYFKKYGEKYEGGLMRKIDAVVANSIFLKENASKYNQKSFYVGQGCDLELFSHKSVKDKPDDLKEIKGSVIGYIGALKSSRLDLELLQNIFLEKKDWNLVLVGPEDETFQNSQLHQMENVYFLGSKKLEELPTYTHYFDVAINPQSINELTVGNYPRKIDEYLAMGKPCVATDTKAMQIFCDFVYLAKNNASEYIDCISNALAENTKEKESKRIEFALTHSWENSVLEIYRVIKEIEN